jgi:hypothetical protein
LLCRDAGTQGHRDEETQGPSSLKGWDVTAQGIALGRLVRIIILDVVFF